MSDPRRPWITTFADEAVLSDLMAAARYCMRQICNHEPEDCDCSLNRFRPDEFVEWLELEVRRSGEPMNLRPAGQPNRRRDGQLRINLAVSA